MTETFGEYLRNLRNGKDYTLTQLAAKLGIDSSTLSKIETGKKNFDAKLLKKLSGIFKLDEDAVRKEFYSELIAKILFDNHCSEEILSMAAQKINILKAKNIKQGTINF